MRVINEQQLNSNLAIGSKVIDLCFGCNEALDVTDAPSWQSIRTLSYNEYVMYFKLFF